MAIGRRKSDQQRDLFVMASDLPKSAGHVFYSKLNELLAEAGFDRWIEQLCEPYYANGKGRPGIPPGVYFRMLLVGYFEGIQSQRGIAWRCGDSLSLRSFLGVPLTDATPDHSSLTTIRDRLPQEIHEAVFVWVLKLAAQKRLLSGKTVAVDSSALEANAAMKSIVQRETGEDWKQYVIGLMKQEGVIAADAEPSFEEIVRFDKNREGKSVSNEQWASPVDPDARIARMKDGTTHLAYKAENVVDMDSSLILAGEVYAADQADSATLEDSVHAAQAHLATVSAEAKIREVVADKGYHSTDLLEKLQQRTQYRSYIAERKPRSGKRNWSKTTTQKRKAVEGNRRRLKRKKGKELQRRRSEQVERTFAHVLETGGGRRTWVRGRDKVRKRYSLATAAYNLGVIMRLLFNVGTARGLQGLLGGLKGLLALYYIAWTATKALLDASGLSSRSNRAPLRFNPSVAA
jgi:transposase